MKKFWTFSFFFLFFAAVAAYMPFLVLFFQSLGFSGTQIGLLTALGPLVTMVATPIWTNWADRTNQHRLIMSACLLLGLGSVLLLPLMTSFVALLAVIVLSNVFLMPILSFANSATMYMLGPEKDLYGRVRVGGTIGFGISTLIAGVLVEGMGLPVAFWMAAGLLLIAFLIGLRLEYGPTDQGPIGEEGSIRGLFKNPQWVPFLLLAFVGGISLAMANNYFYPYMRELGSSESAMGLAMTIGTIVEVPVLILADHFIRRFNAYGTLILATAITGLRFVLFGLAGDPLLVMIIQMLNGLTIPLLMVAGVAYADHLSPASLRTTGQGLFNAAMLGIGTAVGGFAGGLLLVTIGGQDLYMVTGLFVLIVLALVSILHGRLPAPVKLSS